MKKIEKRHKDVLSIFLPVRFFSKIFPPNMQNNPISNLKHSVPVASLRRNPEDVSLLCVCVCVSDGADAMGGNAQSALVHSVKLY